MLTDVLFIGSDAKADYLFCDLFLLKVTSRTMSWSTIMTQIGFGPLATGLDVANNPFCLSVAKDFWFD